MPRYYSQAVTAVELPDDTVGCLPESALTVTRRCFFLLLIADFDRALLCEVVCFHCTVSSVLSIFNEKQKSRLPFCLKERCLIF